MKKYKYVFKLLIFVFVVLLIIYIPQNLIKISKIECVNGDGTSCSSDIQNSFNRIVPAPLKKVKISVKNITGSEFLLEDYSTQFKLPGVLKVTLIEAKPRYAIKYSDGKIANISKDGYVLSVSNTSSLPFVLSNETAPNPKSRLNQEIFEGVKIYSLASIYQKVKSAQISEDYLDLNLDSNVKVIAPLDKDPQIIVGSLNLIIGRLIKDGEKITIDSEKEACSTGCEIDLRYKNPIVRKLS